jgi:hypothetical protein
LRAKRPFQKLVVEKVGAIGGGALVGLCGHSLIGYRHGSMKSTALGLLALLNRPMPGGF